MCLNPRILTALLVCSLPSILFAVEFPDTDGDEFIDSIELRYGSPSWVGDPERMPAHGVPIMMGQTLEIDAVRRFPEMSNAVAIDAGGIGSEQYVLVLQGSGQVASWSLFAYDSIEHKLNVSGQWQGSHPRQWQGIVEIEVAPFGLFGIAADGSVSMCGEAWAVDAVASWGNLREIETSYDSVIVVTKGGEVRTATDGSWAAPSVPDFASITEFSGAPGRVAAGKQTFWALGSEYGVIAWGTPTELAKMDYSAFAGAPLAYVLASPSQAAGLRISRFGLSTPFGDDVTGVSLSSAYGSFTLTPGVANAFSSLSVDGYQTTANFDPAKPSAPAHWQFEQITSTDTALFGILKGGSPLEWAVADELGQRDPFLLNEADWEQINFLNLESLPVASLDGIERATNLDTLYIEGTTVRDLGPLEHLEFLNHMNAARTPVMDLSPISKRSFITLNFQDTAAAEANQELRTAFGYQARRIYADVLARNTTNLSQTMSPPPWWHQFDPELADLVRMNGFGALSGLADLSIVNILQSNVAQTEGLQLRSLRGIALLSGLYELAIPDQGVSDISELADLPLLESIDLSNNPVADLSALLRLPALQSVDISDTGAAEILDAAPVEMPVRQELVATLSELARRGVSVTNSSAVPRDDWYVHFEPETAAALRDYLNLSGPALTLSELAQVHEFNPDESTFEITDFSGLQYAWEIQEIRLYEQTVSDLSPLKDLPYLSRLYIQNYFNEDRSQRVEDLSPLAGHPSLEHVELNGSNVLDIHPLLDLPRLQHLELNDTFFAELIQFGDPSNPVVKSASEAVQMLDINGVPVYTAASSRDDWWRIFEPALGRALREQFGFVGLSQLENLQTLYLENRGLSDLDGMQLLFNLENLELSNNCIVDLSPLSELPKLSSLVISNNPVVDLQPLLAIESLQNVDLSETSAAELRYGMGFGVTSAVGEVEADLAALWSRGVIVQDQPMPRNDWWRHMDGPLSAHILEEISKPDYSLELNELVQIWDLNAPSELQRPIEDLSGIQFLMGLETLFLPNQLITDLTPVSLLSQLRLLEVGNPDLGWPMNRLSNLGPLSGHTQLEQIYLANTDVLELEPLATLPVLNEVNLGGTFAGDLIGNGAQDNPYAQRARRWLSNFQGFVQTGAVTRTDWWRVFDPMLGAALASEEAASGNLTLSFIEQLTGFSAAEKGIESLDHIGLLYSLRSLQLSSNPITDLHPLVELTELSTLYLNWVGTFAGKVPDIQPLAEVRSLQVLDLSDNPLLDIEPLLSLPLLESVNLRNTYVENDPGNPAYWMVTVLDNRGVLLDIDTQERYDWSWLFEPQLAAAITEQLGWNPGAGFSYADLLQLTQLDAPAAGIESLEGLELAENLQILNLENNSITDLSPLESLTKLIDLNLGTDVLMYPAGNLFRDLSPLGNLWSLQSLNLRGAPVRHFDLLANLPTLNSVNLQDTLFDLNSELSSRLNAYGITVASGGKLEASRVLAPSLYAAIIGRQGLVDFNQIDLHLDEMGITCLEGIWAFRQLEILSLRDNSIVDLSPLEGMSELREINLDNSGYDPYSVELWGNQVRDIRVLTTLPKLQFFTAEANLICDISPLLECQSLQNVLLWDNFLIDDFYDPSPDTLIVQQLQARGINVEITSRQDWYRLFPDTALAEYFFNMDGRDIAQLGYLEINAPIYDLSGLEKCYNLQDLRLREAHVQDLSPLAGLQNMRELTLDREDLGTENLLSDLAPLSSLQGLRTMSLKNQGVRDLSVLAELPRLIQVDLSGNLLDLREDTVASTLIASLGNQISFTLGEQRDIWGTVLDPGLERAIRNRFDLSPNEVITQSHWESLTSLNAAGYGIEDISELSLASNLAAVTLVGNRIVDASALSELDSLQVVNLSNSPENFPEMGNEVDNLSVFANNENLRTLNLRDNRVSDVSPLQGMRNLDYINLDGNPLDLRENSDTVRLLTVLHERGTLVVYDDRYRDGQRDGIDAVQSNPKAYSLFTEDQLRGLAMGKPTLELDAEGQFQLKLDVYESINLIDWLPGQGSFEQVDGQFIWKPANPGNTHFYTIEAQ